MIEPLHGNEDDEVRSVPEAVDRRIRLEALRQLDTLNIDDDDCRIEPLPALGVQLSGPVR
ncbi:MAG: hypothetical protein WBM50_17835 [Acidimicrobiales bacterium]